MPYVKLLLKVAQLKRLTVFGQIKKKSQDQVEKEKEEKQVQIILSFSFSLWPYPGHSEFQPIENGMEVMT